MKTLTRLAVFIVALLIGFSSQAQFSSSFTGSVKPGDGTAHPESVRQQDIYLMEQKAKIMERDFFSGNVLTFDNHKTEVLAIMDREISRSSYDLADLRSALAEVEGGPNSPKGRALRIEIIQMEGRSNKQEFIRTQVLEFTLDKIENTRELSGLRAQYFQFIEKMKTNLKYSDGSTSNAASSGKTSNTSVSSGMVTSSQNHQENH